MKWFIHIEEYRKRVVETLYVRSHVIGAEIQRYDWTSHQREKMHLVIVLC